MPPQSSDQRHSLWRLMATLLQVWDTATDPEKQAAPGLWFSAVNDIAESLLVELSSTDRAVEEMMIREADAVAESAAVSSNHGINRAIDGTIVKLEELMLQRDVMSAKRSEEAPESESRASSSYVEALMTNTIGILTRCMELRPSAGREDRPSDNLKAKMCTTILRILGRCMITVEFRRSIGALQSGVFDIKLLGSNADATICVRLDAIWPAPSNLGSSFGLGKNPGSGPACVLRCRRLEISPKCHAILANETRPLLLSHGCLFRPKGVTRDDILNLLQEWVSKGLRHRCAQQVTRSDIEGRKDIQESITAQLLSAKNKKQSSVIYLAAKRGAGKTTLVRLIYNDQRVSNAFDSRIWICMSDKFDGKGIMTAIIEHATQVQCDVMELKFLRELVKDELRERKFLLVLEDCHIVLPLFWRDINELLWFGAKGSSIMITTASEGFASHAKHFFTCHPRTTHFYNLSPLRDEHCSQIFKRFAYGDDHDHGSHHGLMKFSNNVINNCGGNPLYVRAICGLLCHAKSALQQLDNLKEAFLPDLRLCCDLLPHHLKLCLSLCSLFPKDFVYVRHLVIRLWMSQGLINSEEFGEPEEIGTRYFNELLCRSFFDYSSLHYDNGDKFVMHKLFHDLVTFISRDVFFRCEDRLCRIPENVRHLSLAPWKRPTVVALKPVTIEVGDLDTFLVVNRYELQNSIMSSPCLKLVGLDDFFLKFKSLKTLNLSYTIIGQLPGSIGNLKYLQYLAANNTDIRSLPSELCLLENLQTLEVRDCRQLVSLPENTKNLVKLRHLDVRKQPGYVRMPFGVGQLVHLHTLPVLNVGEDSSDFSIWELRNLDNLHGDLAITGLENIKLGNDAKEAKLINKKCLKTLTLEWGDNSIYMEEDSEEIAHEILESLQPPSDLENLTIRSYSACFFPLWIDRFPFDSLLSITLDNCYNCTVLPALGDLPSLKYLCIRKMYALQKFGYASSLPEKKIGGKFPVLELLKLWEMYELEGWIGVEDGDFPRLHNVSICGCPNLMSLPRFPSLVDLTFRCCNQLPEIPGLQKLESLKIEDFQDIVTLDLPQGLPALKKLEISRCNELVSVVGLSTISSVEKLKIVKCPKLDVVNRWQQYHFKKIIITRDATVIST